MVDPLSAAVIGGLAGMAISKGQKPEQIIAQSVDYDRLLRVIKSAIGGVAEPIVLLDDDFSLGLNKYFTVEGNGAVALSSDYAAFGSLSAKLTMDAGAVSSAATISYRLGYPLSYMTLIGLEFWFATDDEDVPVLAATFEMADGSIFYGANVYYSTVDKTVNVVHKDGTLKTPAKTLSFYDYKFHRLKYVFNLASKEYLYFQLNDWVYPLTDYEIYESSLPLGQEIRFSIGVQKTDAVTGGSDTYIGRVRFTLGEPNTIPANITS